MSKKNWREISTDKYIIAGMITFLIFSLGLTLGLVFEDSRNNIVEEINQEQDVKYLSLQLQHLFLSTFSNNNNCPILSTTLKATVKDLDQSLGKVIAFEEEDTGDSNRKEIIQRRYILDNLRYWLLAVESKKRCNIEIVPILYFYTADCPSCPTQGTVLTYFKNLFDDKVLVFPINIELKNEEPMVEMIASQFGIDQVPTLIINNKKYEGVVKKAQMEKIVCESLDNAKECED